MIEYNVKIVFVLIRFTMKSMPQALAVEFHTGYPLLPGSEMLLAPPEELFQRRLPSPAAWSRDLHFTTSQLGFVLRNSFISLTIRVLQQYIILPCAYMYI